MVTGVVRSYRYEDPTNRIWLATAHALGLTVRRADDVYAATDGRGTLTIAVPTGFDPDDSLAQMIFHEICHWLVAGLDAKNSPDWGMDNVTDRDAWIEHAALRCQYVLSHRYGLEGFFAPTTDYRAFWDALPQNPVRDRSDRSVRAALAGLHLSERKPFAPALAEALTATARIAAAVSTMAGESGTLWQTFRQPSAHPTGAPEGFGEPDATCGNCAWRGDGVRGACRHSAKHTLSDWPGCERWEPALDCLTCGACCREAYHAVEVGPREAFVRTHPELIVLRAPNSRQIARTGDRCAALSGGDVVPQDATYLVTPYRCTVYGDRPRTCRDFTKQSHNCLDARRRVGMSL